MGGLEDDPVEVEGLGKIVRRLTRIPSINYRQCYCLERVSTGPTRVKRESNFVETGWRTSVSERSRARRFDHFQSDFIGHLMATSTAYFIVFGDSIIEEV